ncbi:MAG: hypothetical protein EPO08_20095 [Rhodospirillaceae bacterium]|nr:MAG: hypothetical protein EPO08_20095 [Rhodospirillaceae bacterium]
MSGDNKMQAMDARRKSEAKLAQSQLQDKAFFKERKRIEAVNAEKTARLKALRLAKEAVDREAKEKAAAEEAARPRKTRASRGSRVATGNARGITSVEVAPADPTSES